MFTLGVCDKSALPIKHPLFPLCICFEIVPDNPFRVVILLYPHSDIYLFNILPLSVLYQICLANFCQFCQCLQRIKTDDDHPETSVVCFVLSAYALFSSVSGTGPWELYQFFVWSTCWGRGHKTVHFMTPIDPKGT